MKTNKVSWTLTGEPILDLIVFWTPFNLIANVLLFPSNKLLKSSRTKKSPKVQPAKVLLSVFSIVSWNSLNDAPRVESVGIPTVPPTPIDKTSSWP